MKLRLLCALSLVIATSQAMIKKTDSALHMAAKAGNYPACYAILTASLRTMPSHMPSKEVLETIRNSFNQDLSMKEQSKEWKTAMRIATKCNKEFCEQQPQELIKQRAIITSLRTAINAEGLIARECCAYDTPERLRQLLDPSYDLVSIFLNSQVPDVILPPLRNNNPEEPGYNIGDPLSIKGETLYLREVCRINKRDRE